MEVKRINYWIVVVILSLTSLWVVLFYTRDKNISQGIVKMIEVPYKIDKWQGKDIELDERILQILGTDKVILREYRTPENDVIWLYIVYCEKDRTRFRPPEYCYIGSGEAELIERDLVNIPISKESLLVNRLIFQTPNGMQMVLFWFMVNEKMFASYYKQQLYIVLNTLTGKGYQGAMVRLSSYFQTEDKEENLEKLKAFIKDLLPYLKELKER